MGMKLSERQRRFTLMVAELIRWAYGEGYELTFGEAYRTEEQQKIYLESGRSRTMNSRHRERLAVDLNLFIGGEYRSRTQDYRPLGEYWKSLGGAWGGDFSFGDGNHFEYGD